jgi:hypothetical protein
MGKDFKTNKKHHCTKDRKHKKERSKKEHLKRKEKEKKIQEDQEEEQNRYVFDSHSHKKLIKILRDLINYNPETVEAVCEVFNMLDSPLEVDITDIEDGVIRESLEKIIEIFSKQVEKTEDADGRFVYNKVGKKNLKDQIQAFFSKAKSTEIADNISDISVPKLPSELYITQDTNNKDMPDKTTENAIRNLSAEYEKEFRPKSLMEMHLEKNKNLKSKAGPEQYIYGRKSLQKRFAQGKYLQ